MLKLQDVAKLLGERNKSKEIVRNEVQSELDKLQKEIAGLKEDKENEMQQVYSRWRTKTKGKILFCIF